MLKKISLALISSFLCVSSQAESDNVFHNSLMVLDTHLDTPALLVRPGFDIMESHSHDKDFSQVDIPRMEEGGLDGGFWVIYTPQGPLTKEAYQSNRDTALLRSMAIHNMVEKHSDTFELATLAEDGPRIHKSGKKVVYISMENAYPLGEDISLLTTFYKMGLRMMGPVHFKNNQFGDSSTDPDGPKWGGLSPLGKELVKEANRLGIVLDGSHGHDALVVDLIEQSKTPIILSHTGTKAIYDHPRNIDDKLLRKLAKSGGVIHVNAYSSYLKKLPQDPSRKIAYGKLFKLVANKSSTFSAKEWQEVNQKRYAIDQEHPEVKATFDDYMEHFLHILKIAGPKHVGVGADWDGGGGVVKMMDIATLPLITQRLIDEGYSKQDLADIWGTNALRLIKKAQEYAEKDHAG
jgi:membrane dipeptidase